MLAVHIATIWLTLGEQIHQDFSDDGDIEAEFSLLFDNFSPTQRRELYAFLIDVNNKNLTDGELAKLWFESGAQFYVLAPDVREFFRWLTDLLRGSLQKHGELSGR